MTFLPTDPLLWGLAVAFAGALGFALYSVFPEEQQIEGWKETFYNRQKARMLNSAIEPNSVGSKLQRAGINLHPFIFTLICVAFAAIITLSVASFTKNIVAGLIMAVLGYQIPLLILDMINKSYDKKMEIQINILISTTSGTIKSTGSMLKALESISRIVDDPLRTELVKIIGATRFNKTLEAGFIELANKTGNTSLTTYASIVEIATTQGTQAAADSFDRLHKLVEQEEAAMKDRKAQLAEYTMFVLGVIVGLPVIYVIAVLSIGMAQDALVDWFIGKIATAAIAALTVGSYLGYKASTRR